ncbi:hypothetical protein JRQ81_006697 [Phrynocephalus forsythii]|uniref:Lactadherin n=1 Tax=Phrynocephalus forsythii TaxID=171643 RepID=A0A9Q0XDH3_9SAUR|nr:hypothetical protein JRQ81_006697 [Phrynocephalus forsythii]
MERSKAGHQLGLGLLLAFGALLARGNGDSCEVNQCQNGGTCLTNVDDSPFFCICAEGFTGVICNETETGPCHPNPCRNGGECQLVPNRGDAFTEYICKCPSGYEGKHCQNNMNECASQPCKNGGSCVNLNGDYVCKCASPYFGKSCHMRCGNFLGMETGAIANGQLMASSVHHGFLGIQRWGPELARLNNKGIVNAWTASNYDKKPWIQVNLLRKMRISGVITQGASRVGRAEYVTAFKVAYSLDGHEFVFLKDGEDDTDKTFSGNRDNEHTVTNMFNPPVVAQYIRIHCMLWHRACTLRFELIGCEINGCSEPLGMKSHLISDQQITASSTHKTWGIFTWYPHYARLDKTGKSNAWAALTNKQDQWLQIDLRDQKKLTGIITQGARDFGHIQYVGAYKVAYSNDGVTWTIYKDSWTNKTKIFEGNHDNYSHKKNVFDEPFYARFVRILPESWHNRITLRLELLGCDD